MKMRDLVSVGDRQGQTRNTRVLHLRLHVGVTLRKIRRGFRNLMPRRGGGKRQPGEGEHTETPRTDERSAHADFHHITLQQYAPSGRMYVCLILAAALR